MRSVVAVLEKQIKDTWKNKTVLIQFLMFPFMTILMNHTVRIETMPKHFFTELFAVMYLGMAPLVSATSILSEEKERGTLRALLMAGVKPGEYLLGVGLYVWAGCMIGSLLMVFFDDYTAKQASLFLLVAALGIPFSLVIGACVGIASRSQMAATSLSVPLMLLTSFLPMLAMFNTSVEAVARYTYPQQLKVLLVGAERGMIGAGSCLILLGNGLFLLVLFMILYKKNGLE